MINYRWSRESLRAGKIQLQSILCAISFPVKLIFFRPFFQIRAMSFHFDVLTPQSEFCKLRLRKLCVYIKRGQREPIFYIKQIRQIRSCRCTNYISQIHTSTGIHIYSSKARQYGLGLNPIYRVSDSKEHVIISQKILDKEILIRSINSKLDRIRQIIVIISRLSLICRVGRLRA